MRKKYLIIINFLFFIWEINAQNSLFAKFPIIDSTQTSIDAEELLEELNWEGIKKYCDTTEGHYARINETNYTKTYKYTKQGNTANFTLVEFKGKVLAYHSHVNQLFQTNYFDKKLWVEYTKLDDDFRNSKWLLSEKEMSENDNIVIQSYYTLLGFNSRDEYGWICEYSASGFPPDKRLATIELINHERRDFLVKLLDYPNTQTKLYAADALIYLDMVQEIEKVELDKFDRKKRKNRYSISYNSNYKLSKSEWRKIYRIKDKNLDVVTCGNMGSYKQYKSTTGNLLSEESINEIYRNYQLLREFGYLK